MGHQLSTALVTHREALAESGYGAYLLELLDDGRPLASTGRLE